MIRTNLDDTIVALSTPIGEGGIGIVRLSGKDAIKIADKIFLSKDRKKVSSFKTYTVHYGHVVDRDKGIVDEVILTVMRAPKSYTKEDVVEINCHSGIAPLKKILDITLSRGARLAEPGEFTKRSFLNGRIDILQAESVLDIIRAKTEASLRLALNNLDGHLSRKIEGLRDRLISVYSHIEASLDFSDEEDTLSIKKGNIARQLNTIEKDIEKLASSAKEGKILRKGIKTVICGSPNVGKSSLMNAILKESRSIVTHFPGTTRDTIEEAVNIKGIPVVLIDTAGIADSKHPIDREGIKRSKMHLDSADLVLLVLDGARPLNRFDRSIIKDMEGKNVILVINKMDLPKRLNIEDVKRPLPKRPIVFVSAISSLGIDTLERKIKDLMWKGKIYSAGSTVISNERQLGILRRALRDIKEARTSYKRRVSLDCVSIYIRSSIELLGEITGHTITEQTLDRIFSEFCIGK